MCASLEAAAINGATVMAHPPCGGGAKVCSGRCARIAEMLAPPPAAESIDNLPIAISDGFAADILKPYRKNATYLKSAEITQFNDKATATPGAQVPMLTARGRFAIPESCYIDDTGHFNAVEFNICYNQLAYVAFAKAALSGVLGRLRNEKLTMPSLDEFKRHQLPAMMIVSIESRYFKQLNSRDFTGEITLNKASSVGPAWFFSTAVSFSDSEGLKAKGSVMLAYSETYAPVRH